MLKHLLERRQDEEQGFTLIELMVVVLIMGILMAIAIPTFLSTRGSANDASAKSNATNVFTSEKSYYAANQIFETANATTNGSTLDDSLPWGDTTSKGGLVEAYLVPGATCSDGTCSVVIQASSSSGNCFYIFDSETSNSAIIAYDATKAACADLLASQMPSAAPATGTSSGVSNSAVVGGAAGTNNWAASW